jgi:hypothetical protein
VEPEGICPQNLELRWMSEVASSVYATPLITDLYSDGHKDIVVPSFVHHLEVRHISEHVNLRGFIQYTNAFLNDAAGRMAVQSAMQVLEASDGAQAAGWPAFHKSTVHTSPVMYDLDFDGVQDILLATYGGEILAFRDNVRPVRMCCDC